jgi:hypothetical protein
MLVPSRPAEWVSLDFITSLPPLKWRGRVYDAILVVVDLYTKYALYLTCTKDIDAQELAQLWFTKVLPLIGMPKNLVSDRGSLFTSEFWSSFYALLRTNRRLSTAFHL